MSDSILTLDQLGISFGGVRALDQVSFSVAQGSITALIGPNGAGKTTALNCISGVHRADSGRVLFKGKPINGTPTHRRARMGLTRTFQNLQVFAEMTVLENVMLGLHGVTSQGFMGAIFRLPGGNGEEQGILERAQAMLAKIGLDHLAGTPAGQLSYGDQKRVEMARALVSRPSLVLLDEPAAGLNPGETDTMARVIQEVGQDGVSILLVEHDMEMVMGISHWVVVLDYGRKIAEGTPHQVQNHPEVIRTYLGGSEELVDCA